MNYLRFKKDFEAFKIFSVKDIEKKYAHFDRRRLYEWQQKKLILKIRRGYYTFTDEEKNENFLYFASNKIYAPSYISLESGLAYYYIIPEGVFITTAVTTNNTSNFNTKIGTFNYKSIKKNLFFGYSIKTINNVTFKIAEIEKLILDYLYFKKVSTLDDLKAMRLNKDLLVESINIEKLSSYQKLFNSKTLNKRVHLFKEMIYA